MKPGKTGWPLKIPPDFQIWRSQLCPLGYLFSNFELVLAMSSSSITGFLDELFSGDVCVTLFTVT